MPTQSLGQQLGGQPGVQVGEPPPVGEHPHVVGERLRLARHGPSRQGPQQRAVRAEERLVQPFQLVKVPPLADLRGRVAEGQVVGAEQVGVARRARAAAASRPCVSCRWAGTIHTPGRDHAEAQPGQLATAARAACAARTRAPRRPRAPSRRRGWPGPAGRSARHPRAGWPAPRRTAGSRPRRRGAATAGCRAASAGIWPNGRPARRSPGRRAAGSGSRPTASRRRAGRRARRP